MHQKPLNPSVGRTSNARTLRSRRFIFWLMLSFGITACGEDEASVPPTETPAEGESVTNTPEDESESAASGGSILDRMRAQAAAERRQGTEGSMTFKVNGEPREMAFFATPSNRVATTATAIGGYTDVDRTEGLEIVLTFIDVRRHELPMDFTSAPAARTMAEATALRPTIIFTYVRDGEGTRVPGRDIPVHIESFENGFLTGSVEEVQFGRGADQLTVSDVAFRVNMVESAGADVAGSAIVGATNRALGNSE